MLFLPLFFAGDTFLEGDAVFLAGDDDFDSVLLNLKCFGAGYTADGNDEVLNSLNTSYFRFLPALLLSKMAFFLRITSVSDFCFRFLLPIKSQKESVTGVMFAV